MKFPRVWVQWTDVGGRERRGRVGVWQGDKVGKGDFVHYPVDVPPEHQRERERTHDF